MFGVEVAVLQRAARRGTGDDILSSAIRKLCIDLRQHTSINYANSRSGPSFAGQQAGRQLVIVRCQPRRWAELPVRAAGADSNRLTTAAPTTVIGSEVVRSMATTRTP